MTEIELAWFTGLFEGEGCIFVPPDRGGFKLIVAMTDKDTIERVQKITGIGKINLKTSDKRSNRKPTWIWNPGKWEEVKPLLEKMLPYLGERRKLKAQQALSNIPLHFKNECVNGHIKSKENIYLDPRGWKQCRVCREKARIRYLNGN